MTRVKSDSISKERQFGKDMTGSVMNNALQLSKKNADKTSDSVKSLMFPTLKKIQV